MYDDYRLPEPVYVGTPQLLQSIIDTMPISVLSHFKTYSDAITIATSYEDRDKAMDTLISERSIYDIDAYVFWAKTYARLNPKKEIIGIDTDIETSLKEYGYAWSISDNELTVYYGIKQELNDCNDYEWIEFNWASYPMNINVREEWNWVNFSDINSFVGSKFFEQSLHYKIYDLLSYYGYENVFGTSYCNGITLNNVIKEQK